MKSWREFKCGCCGIDYEIEAEHWEPLPIGCDGCRGHLYARTAQELLEQRRDHVALWNSNLDSMSERIESAEARTRSVYHTRGLALAILNKINGAHDGRPDGSCTCGTKSCKVGPTIAENTLLHNVIRAYDVREQQRLRRLTRDEFYEGADEWDYFIDRNMVNTPTKGRRDNKTG